jgi:hypothetical protein
MVSHGGLSSTTGSHDFKQGVSKMATPDAHLAKGHLGVDGTL